MEFLASLFVGGPQNILAVAVAFFCGIPRAAVHSDSRCVSSPIAAHRILCLGSLCSMKVGGSGKDTRSEHQGRPARDMAGAGNYPGVGIVPRFSIGALHRSAHGWNRHMDR